MGHSSDRVVASALMVLLGLSAIIAVNADINATTTALLNCRNGPSTSFPVSIEIPAGSLITVSCLVRGETISGNQDWLLVTFAYHVCWSTAFCVNCNAASCPVSVCSNPACEER